MELKYCETIYDARLMSTLYNDAIQNKMWFMVSHIAGGGKTAAAKNIASKSKFVLHIECGEWSRRQFIQQLSQRLGLHIGNEDAMIAICGEIKRQKLQLLIIDEGDKLKPAAYRTLITLYNEIRNVCGCVLQGTDNLQKELLAGVARSTKGYDEIASRFGRKFIHLRGASEKEVTQIAIQNGLSDVVARTIWTAIEDSYKIRIENKVFLKDMRRLEKVVEAKLLQN
jgi:DNA transposition AAA+ family ATPase